MAKKPTQPPNALTDFGNTAPGVHSVHTATELATALQTFNIDLETRYTPHETRRAGLDHDLVGQYADTVPASFFWRGATQKTPEQVVRELKTMLEIIPHLFFKSDRRNHITPVIPGWETSNMIREALKKALDITEAMKRDPTLQAERPDVMPKLEGFIPDRYHGPHGYSTLHSDFITINTMPKEPRSPLDKIAHGAHENLVTAVRLVHGIGYLGIPQASRSISAQDKFRLAMDQIVTGYAFNPTLQTLAHDLMQREPQDNESTGQYMQALRAIKLEDVSARYEDAQIPYPIKKFDPAHPAPRPPGADGPTGAG